MLHVLSLLTSLLVSLYMNDYTAKDPSVKILKFANDITVIGLIHNGDKSAYRQEVIVDFRRNSPALTIRSSTVAAVETLAAFPLSEQC